MSDTYKVFEDAFNRGSFFLQMYDDDFNEYIDLEDIVSIKNKCKLRALDVEINSNQVSIYQTYPGNCLQTFAHQEDVLSNSESDVNVKVALN